MYVLALRVLWCDVILHIQERKQKEIATIALERERLLKSEERLRNEIEE